MTLVVAWYRERFKQLWVAADTRITSGADVITDHGPKIFQIPVVCQKLSPNGESSRIYRTNYGFAFAGSTISALGTHALGSACCQNLSANRKIDPPSVQDVAQLYRKLAEIQIREICSRLHEDKWRNLFFYGIIFGFCLRKKRYQIWVIESHLTGNNFQVVTAELPALPKVYYPIGSGVEQFVRMMKAEEDSGSGWGVSYVLGKMIVDGVEPTVGGHTQFATVSPKGVQIPPVLVLGEKENAGNTTFLGVAVDVLGKVGGFNIGYHAVGPDEHELAVHAAAISK